ncbi:prepilin-type N-terminal cleavage/methylation domain-containing protein [Candidatus Nitrosacidococcus tergens]|uniref:General secretion pathway protein J n=1 Tax=Candidatus Nitrosacidococcus tergens TaxID=553981 RepID=A0A7G1Q7F0_9GAMM|nr:prepilin-type N-terminal cleavage/methylation domain-containing protein [Candidatus Nitrosacidococcus tergens]CAB1274319.1 General secretion pathway protein J [Candidatus Nitrosacidococcus tergens]
MITYQGSHFHTQKVSGFTLVELLIAITLMGIIIVILFAGLRLATRSWEGVENKNSTTERFRVINHLFRRQIRSLSLPFYIAPNRGRALAFFGSEQSISFVAPFLEDLDLGGLYWITYELTYKDGESALVMYWRPYRPNEQQINNSDREVLLENISAIHFSYFGALNQNLRPNWYNYWDNPNQPPQVIQLKIEANDVEWPGIVAKIQTDPQNTMGGGAGAIRFGR